MDIERLRALEKDIRESVALADAEALGVMGINRPARWADELATLIAELGQEVGAVEVPHPLGERHAAIEKALKGHTLLLMSRDHVNDQKKPLAEIKFGMSTDLGVLFCLADTDAPMPVDTSPAHTSEARDAARYRWLRDSAACSLSISHNDHHNMYMSVADTFDSTDGYYNDIGNDERAKMIETDTIWTLHVYPNTPVGFNVYHGSSLDAVCDAAMRQEGGTP